MDIDMYVVIAILGQMLGGVVMAVGVVVGLRLALPSLARTLARELEAARVGHAEDADSSGVQESSRPVVTLQRRDELKN